MDLECDLSPANLGLSLLDLERYIKPLHGWIKVQTLIIIFF